MAETAVKNLNCQTCGADVRSEALFCYYCGGSVAPETVVALKDKDVFDDAPVRAVAEAEKNGDKSEPIKQTVVEKNEDQTVRRLNPNEEPELKSAATMRRRAKTFQPKRVEIIWEEYENPKNAWFIAAAILLVLFTVGILYLAIYLK